MDRRHWVIATAIVLGMLAFLLWDPGSPTAPPAAEPAARATIVELGEDAELAPITTVEIEPPPAGDSGPGAGSALIARFENERANPAWSERARVRLTTVLEPALDAHEGSIAGMECRASACRVTLEFPSEEARPDGVAAALGALQEAGMPSLVERADNTRAVLLAAP